MDNTLAIFFILFRLPFTYLFFIVNLVINRPIHKMRFLRFGPTTKDFINGKGLDFRKLV